MSSSHGSQQPGGDSDGGSSGYNQDTGSSSNSSESLFVNDVEEELENADQEDEDERNDPSVRPDIMGQIELDNEEDRRQGSRSHKRSSKKKPKQCRIPECVQAKQRVTELEQELEKTKELWNEEVQTLKEQNLALNAEIKGLKNQLKETPQINRTPWDENFPDLLRRLRDPDPNDNIKELLSEYKRAYCESFRQGNMSMKVTHPNLDIEEMEYTSVQIQGHFGQQLLRDRFNGSLNVLRGIRRPLRAIIFPLRCMRLRPLQYLENAPFPFERLPAVIQYRIWKLIIPNNELIHCVSRLDRLNPPFYSDPRYKFYPRRFHIGVEPCCLALADRPSRYLDYFRVSKRWNYATAHLFYAANTFAFSSLGEFGRFCNGIGKPRVERLVHIELMWHGVVMPKQEKGKISLRKEPLAWFMHTSRLRTLVVHINESHRSYMRRPDEMEKEKDYYEDFGGEEYDGHDGEDSIETIFGMEVRRTDTQPNYRKNRSMRTVQGMDYIYQLRGLNWVRFYDTNAEYARTFIRDTTFLRDVNNAVRTRKTASMSLQTEVENLRPLTGLAEFTPDDETRELVARFYDDTPVEDVSAGGSETSSSSSSRSSGFSSHFSSSSSSGSDDDDDSGDSSRSSSSSSSSGSGGPGPDPIMFDSDTDMDDNEVEPSASTGSSSGSGSSSFSGFGNGDGYPRGSGLTPSVPSHPPVIVIEDDDDRDHRPARRNYSTDEKLFVTSGSCTAHSDPGPDSDDDNDDDDDVVFLGEATALIDLTLDDDDDDNQDSGTMTIHADTQNDSEEEINDNMEVKSESDVKSDDYLETDEDDNDNEDDDVITTVKTEATVSPTPSASTSLDESDSESDSDSNPSVRHSKRKGDFD
ncbi:hypothetical protein F5Y03DRAFT_403078 [Xylaria venustula]|nr:hypothetical protein F5Y03DRAFT_403078 [Xylaria venustula]